jgi:hypothetical protein
VKQALIAILVFFGGITAAFAQRVEVPDTTVSFESPPGFTALTREEIQAKYPKASGPGFVVGNKARTTSIAYDIKPIAIGDKDLPDLMAAFGERFEKAIPGLAWKDRKLIEMDGQRWVYLEMTSTAVDTDIHNIMLITPHAGKLLMFNFNSTREEFPDVEALLRSSIESIALGKVEE